MPGASAEPDAGAEGGGGVRRFVVEETTRYVVTLNDTFRETYTGNDGQEHSRGPITELARDIAIRWGESGRSLSEMDGYADLPDDAAEVRETDFDSDVWEVGV